MVITQKPKALKPGTIKLTQTLQYPLIMEYALNHIRDPIIV